MESNHKCGAVLKVLVTIIAIVFAAAAPCLAQSDNDEQATQTAEQGWVRSSCVKQQSNEIKQRIAYASNPEIQQTALSIVRMAIDMGTHRNNVMVIKVPTYNFFGILAELQNQHAKFLPHNSQAPSSAKAVFRLEAEQAGLSQTVYLPN